MMTNVRSIHKGSPIARKTECGRTLGLPLKGGNVYLNGSHRLVVEFDDLSAVTCNRCLQRVAARAKT